MCKKVYGGQSFCIVKFFLAVSICGRFNLLYFNTIPKKCIILAFLLVLVEYLNISVGTACVRIEITRSIVLCRICSKHKSYRPSPRLGKHMNRHLKNMQFNFNLYSGKNQFKTKVFFSYLVNIASKTSFK